MRRNPDFWAIGFVVLLAAAVSAVSNVSSVMLDRVTRNHPEAIERRAELLSQRVEAKARQIEERASQVAERIEREAQRHADRAEKLGKIFE